MINKVVNTARNSFWTMCKSKEYKSKNNSLGVWVLFVWYFFFSKGWKQWERSSLSSRNSNYADTSAAEIYQDRSSLLITTNLRGTLSKPRVTDQGKTISNRRKLAWQRIRYRAHPVQHLMSEYFHFETHHTALCISDSLPHHHVSSHRREPNRPLLSLHIHFLALRDCFKVAPVPINQAKKGASLLKKIWQIFPSIFLTRILRKKWEVDYN